MVVSLSAGCAGSLFEIDVIANKRNLYIGIVRPAVHEPHLMFRVKRRGAQRHDEDDAPPA